MVGSVNQVVGKEGPITMQATERLPRSSPRAEGVAAGGIAGFLDAIAGRGIELHSVMVLRHGRVIAEGWWQPYTAQRPHMLYSLSKSFTSTAVGLLVHEGQLSLEAPVISFFPDDLPAVVSSHLGAMRVRHLLTMGTGHDQDATARMRTSTAGSWVKGFLHLSVEHAPGSKFVYNSAATYMLSAIVQRVTGLTLLDYLTPRLLEPLGIRGATWESSPEGIHTGGWGLSLRTEDIAAFGQLYVQRGMWHGQRCLPEAWVDAATSLQIGQGVEVGDGMGDGAADGNANGPRRGPAPDGGNGNPSDWAQGYGYQFWRCRHGAYRGDGMYGQFCIVLPAQQAVVAITGGTDDLQGVLDAVWDHLLPAMAGEGARTSERDEALRARLAMLTLAPGAASGAVPGAAGAGEAGPWVAGGGITTIGTETAGGSKAADAADPDRAPPASGVRYTLAPNAAQLEALTVEMGGDRTCQMTLVQDGHPIVLRCGFDRWIPGHAEAAAGDGASPCAGHASWDADGGLRLTWYFLQTPLGYTLRIAVAGDSARVHYRPHVGPLRQGVTLHSL